MALTLTCGNTGAEAQAHTHTKRRGAEAQAHTYTNENVKPKNSVPKKTVGPLGLFVLILGI